MGCNIIEGSRGCCYTNDHVAVFFCDTTDWAFGPLMESRKEAEAFRLWLAKDPRSFHGDALGMKLARFRTAQEALPNAASDKEEHALAFVRWVDKKRQAFQPWADEHINAHYAEFCREQSNAQ